MVSMFDQKCFVLLDFDIVLLYHYLCGLAGLRPRHIRVHSRIVIASVLGSVQSTVLRLQLLESLLYLLLSLQHFLLGLNLLLN